MTGRTTIAVSLGALALALSAALAAQSPPRTLAEAEQQAREAAARQQDPAVLADIVNDYRERHGLPRVRVSPLLSMVAQAHVDDMAAQPRGGLAVLERRDPETGQKCNAHSWSDGGDWTPVCFTEGGRRGKTMWDKPREITRGAYYDNGFEIGAWGSLGITPKQALEQWKKSPGHNAVILEEGVWKNYRWQAMGVAIKGNFAYVWFGRSPDPGATE